MARNLEPTPPSNVGCHLLVDLYGVESNLLQNGELLTKWLLEALGETGFHIVESCSHTFPGAKSGATAMALLSESHATIHTYPEFGYVAIDIFSCGSADPDAMAERLIDRLRPKQVELHRQERGCCAKLSAGQAPGDIQSDLINQK